MTCIATLHTEVKLMNYYLPEIKLPEGPLKHRQSSRILLRRIRRAKEDTTALKELQGFCERM